MNQSLYDSSVIGRWTVDNLWEVRGYLGRCPDHSDFWSVGGRRVVITYKTWIPMIT